MNVIQQLATAVVAAAMLVFPSGASAIDFTITGTQFSSGPGYGIDFSESGGSLLDVRFSTSIFQPQSFSLALGESRSFNVGTIDLEEPAVSSGILSTELDGLDITNRLTFTAPTQGIQTFTAPGVAFVGSIIDPEVDFQIDWSPVTIPFGNGGSFRVSFVDMAFSKLGSQNQLVTVTLLALPLTITSIARSSNDILVTYNAAAGKSYRLEHKAAITDAAWQTMAGVVDQTPSVSGPAVFTDPGAISRGGAFYRVRLLP